MSIPKSVFAHHIVGNTAAYGPSDWRNDISLAKAAGIDAFVLNIAAQTDYNNAQIANAYSAAESLQFKLFFSFDYAAQGAWQPSAVIALLQQYANSAAQMKVNGASLVSTFEGPDSSNDWRAIRAAVPIFFLPDWTSVGPDAFRTSKLDVTDGAFSWDAWPQGAQDKTDDSDKAWKSSVGSKAYMMPVSPWFYANLPGKSGSQQIVTWNDYGESHYIGPITAASGIPDGAHRYVDNMPHDHWRDLLPYYIQAYKSGNAPAVTTDRVQVWYRLTPAAAGSNGGTVGNAPWEPPIPANAVVQDKVFFTALVKSPSVLTVQIGNNNADAFQITSPGVFHSSTPFNGRTGQVKVTVSRNGQSVATATGAAITASPADGLTNYNAWVGGSA
ncbi:MAG: hypothetical protein Q9200_000734 [Gallowayella weberi]